MTDQDRCQNCPRTWDVRRVVVNEVNGFSAVERLCRTCRQDERGRGRTVEEVDE